VAADLEQLAGCLTGASFSHGAVLDEASIDFGGMVRHRPLAVVRPADDRDVAETIRFARRLSLPVAARGTAHSTHGQSMARDGLVLDLRSVNHVDVQGREIVAGAGATWEQVLTASLARGCVPPVLTDYLALSVGGTLSVGGVGARSFRCGTQADHVRELTVVTGTGDRIVCSPTQHADLFEASLCGLGQCGVIVGARISLAPAPTVMRIHRHLFSTLDEFLGACTTAAAFNAIEGLQGSAIPNDGRALDELVGDDAAGFVPADVRWVYVLVAVERLDDEEERDGFAELPGFALEPIDLPYFQFALRARQLMMNAPGKSRGVLPGGHPWINVIVPEDRAAPVLSRILDRVTDEVAGRGPILFYPLTRSAVHVPLFRLPDAPRAMKLSLLRNLVDPTPHAIDDAMAFNRSIYEMVRAAGGTRYPIDSVPMNELDWQAHFGPAWAAFAAAKHRYDPDRLLAPHQGIFPARQNFR